MMLRALTFLSTAALSAAFLLPSTFKEYRPASIETIHADHHIVSVKCPGCYYPERAADGSILWAEGIKNSLVFNVSTSFSPHPTIAINDVEVFPNLGGTSRPMIVHQVKTEGDFNTKFDSPKGLIVSNEVAWTITPAPSTEADGSIKNILKFHFKVTALDGVAVTGLDTIEMTLMETSDGFFIESVELQPTTPLGATPTEQELEGVKKECATFPLLCKWKSIIAEKFRNAKNGLRKGCMGRPKHGRPHHTGHHTVHPDEHSNKGIPPVNHEHGHHDYHHHHRQGMEKFLHMFKKIAKHILLPVLIGIVAGMTASLIGMVIGQLTVMLWRRFYRCGNKCRYASLQQSEEADRDDVPEEEKGFLSDEDLPEYVESAESVAPVEKE